MGAGLSLATILEVGQLFTTARQASLTDIVVQTLGVWVGFALRRWWNPQAPQRSAGK
jgi:VanZ family protein